MHQLLENQLIEISVWLFIGVYPSTYYAKYYLIDCQNGQIQHKWLKGSINGLEQSRSSSIANAVE